MGFETTLDLPAPFVWPARGGENHARNFAEVGIHRQDQQRRMGPVVETVFKGQEFWF